MSLDLHGLRRACGQRLQPERIFRIAEAVMAIPKSPSATIPPSKLRKRARGGRFFVSLCARITRCYSARIRVPLEALQVGADVGGMLVSKFAILFKALVNDAL